MGIVIAIVIGCVCLASFVVGAIVILCDYLEDKTFFGN